MLFSSDTKALNKIERNEYDDECHIVRDASLLAKIWHGR